MKIISCVTSFIDILFKLNVTIKENQGFKIEF